MLFARTAGLLGRILILGLATGIGFASTAHAGGPVLNITMTASPTPFAAGQQGTYTITVTNAGAAANIPPISVSDTLPPGITFVSASGTNWTCGNTAPVFCSANTALAAGASTVLTLRVAVGANATSGTNTATITAGDQSCPFQAHCSATVTVAIASNSIPALDARGLALLALAMLVVAGAAQRRRAQ